MFYVENTSIDSVLDAHHSLLTLDVLQGQGIIDIAHRPSRNENALFKTTCKEIFLVT